MLTLSNGFYVRHLHVSGSSNKRVNIRSVAFLNKHNAELNSEGKITSVTYIRMNKNLSPMTLNWGFW